MSKPAIEISGFAELKAAIMKLSNDKDKRAEMRLLLRQIAKPTLQAAKVMVPKSSKPHLVSGKRSRKIIQPGNLQRSLGFITGKQDNPTVYVGPRAKGKFDGWYGHFVEYGHDIYGNSRKYSVYKYKTKERSRNSLERVRGRKIGGNTVKGRVQGTPFMQMAYEATGGGVTAEAEQRVAAFMQRRIDKLSR